MKIRPSTTRLPKKSRARKEFYEKIAVRFMNIQGTRFSGRVAVSDVQIVDKPIRQLVPLLSLKPTSASVSWCLFTLPFSPLYPSLLLFAPSPICAFALEYVCFVNNWSFNLNFFSRWDRENNVLRARKGVLGKMFEMVFLQMKNIHKSN